MDVQEARCIGTTAAETGLIGDFDRPLGFTEQNWVRAGFDGTGIVGTGILFRRSLTKANVEEALNFALERHPRMRSTLVKKHGHLWFQESDRPARVQCFTGWQERMGRDEHPETDPGERSSNAHTLNDNQTQLSHHNQSNQNGNDSDKADHDHGTHEQNGLHCETAFVDDSFALRGGVFEEEVGEKRFKVSSGSEAWMQAVVAAMNEPWPAVPEVGEKRKRDLSEGRKSGHGERENGRTAGGRNGQVAQGHAEVYGEEDEEDKAGVGLASESGESNAVCRGHNVDENIQPGLNEDEEEDEEEEEEEAVCPVYEARLYSLDEGGRSLIILRMHCVVLDRVSASYLCHTLLSALAHSLQSIPLPPLSHRWLPSDLCCTEDMIPREMKDKPFWAHGLDMIGYGLGSTRLAWLPFADTHTHRQTAVVRAALSREDAALLHKACASHGVRQHGAIAAAVCLAAAAVKAVGDRGAHFSVTTLINCREKVPALRADAVGFYHSALAHTHHVKESSEFWSLALRCHEAVERSVNHNKHFKDMSDFNHLMVQAMNHPGLTVAGSLRSALITCFWDEMEDGLEDLLASLDVEDYVGTPTVHGIGPCLGIFEELRSTGLHLTIVYPTPLISPSLIRHTVDRTMEYLVAAAISAREPDDVSKGEDDLGVSDGNEAHTAGSTPLDARSNDREGDSPVAVDTMVGGACEGGERALEQLAGLQVRECGGVTINGLKGSMHEKQNGTAVNVGAVKDGSAVNVGVVKNGTASGGGVSGVVEEPGDDSSDDGDDVVFVDAEDSELSD